MDFAIRIGFRGRHRGDLFRFHRNERRLLLVGVNVFNDGLLLDEPLILVGIAIGIRGNVVQITEFVKMAIIGKVVEEIGVLSAVKNYVKNGMKMNYLFQRIDFIIQNVAYYIVIN